MNDSDGDSSHELDSADPRTPGKPGRKKNPNSQAARRDQNRIAQREFRLRKQQRVYAALLNSWVSEAYALRQIRDLEARVEILSGNKEQSYQEMKGIIEELIKENATLRRLVKDLGNFLGEGDGGWIQKTGWTLDEFSKFVEKADTDTAFEAFSARRRSQGREVTEETGQEQSGYSGSNGKPSKPSTGKKLRSSGISNKGSTDETRLTVLPPVHEQQIFSFPSASSPTSPPWSALSVTDTPAQNSIGLDLSGLAALTSRQPFDTLTSRPLLSSEDKTSFNGTITASQTPISHIRPLSPDPKQREQLDKFAEGVKLIKYHLDNYRRNDAYCLPPSLRPSLVQRTVPHESVIDELANPDLRDSMILLRSRYDLVDCLHDLPMSLEIHGDDVLAHTNWEIKEPWLRRYSMLVEQPLLNICNRWRRERGEPDLSLINIKNGDAPN